MLSMRLAVFEFSPLTLVRYFGGNWRFTIHGRGVADTPILVTGTALKKFQPLRQVFVDQGHARDELARVADFFENAQL